MKRALVTSSKYSPGNMTPEALEALFVGREKTLTDVLKRIATSATGAGKHYILLVGPRGVGKTHFVALLYHRLMSDPQYAEACSRLKVAYLNEEEWGVASFLDLLVRILSALAAGQRDAALDAQIERIYEIHEKDAVRAREAAEALLRQAVGKDTLLLLCENLVDIFQGLGEEGQKRWRAYIQEHPFWTILATTPALFADVQLQTSPFYGFFTERRLEKLDYEMAVQLLKKKAEVDGRAELARAIETPTGRARVRAIHHLAGGNHRVYVIMSEFLDRESLDELVKPFMRMVDDLTPYYQDRMRQLAPQQRKILEFLSRHEVPAMVKLIAQRCLISQQTAAKQLGELAKLGFVQSIKSGRAAYYEIAEPLMRICVEVKDNKTEHLRLFVRFLREWFTARELTARLREICSTGVPGRHVDRLHIEAALRDYKVRPEEPLLQALFEEGRRCIQRRDYAGQVEAYARLADETDRDDYHVLCISALRKLGKLDEATVRIDTAIQHHPQSAALAFEHGAILRGAKRDQEALSEFDRALHLKPGWVVCLCARGQTLMAMGRYSDVIDNENSMLHLDPSHTHSFRQKAIAYSKLDRFAEAEAEARLALEREGPSVVATVVLCDALLMQDKHGQALESADKGLRHHSHSVEILCIRGGALECLHDYEAVVDNEEQLLAIDPTHVHALHRLSEALLILGRYNDAGRNLAVLLEREPRNLRVLHLNILAKSGAEGFQAGAAYLTNVVTMLGAIDAVDVSSDQGLRPAHDLATMMMIEAAAHGPAKLVEQLTEARRTLENPDFDGYLGDAISLLLKALLRESIADPDAWEEALPTLTQALADLPECELPLKMLGAAVRYSRTFDVADLIDLPLEQRALLLDAFEKHPRPAAAADAPSTDSPPKPSSKTRRPQSKRRPARA